MRCRRRLPLLVVALLAMAAACGGSDPSGLNQSRPLERDEANRLADALFSNFEQQGASFTYSGQVGNGTLLLDGEVDFVRHRGHATVSGTGVEAAVVEVVWSDTQVIERVPTLAAELVATGAEPAMWVVREPRIGQRELDDAIAVITGLASERRDNPQLILQEPGSAFLRVQELRGVDVEVLRFGQRTSYWLAVGSGEMLRFEGNNSSGTRRRIIDLSAPGQRSIDAPPGELIVDVTVAGGAYDRAIG